MVKKPNGMYDLDFGNGDLKLSNSLKNAVLLSLSCWSKGQDIHDVADLDPKIGGWWGNALETVEIGSEIWKLFRQKLNDQTANDAKSAAEKALKWMIDDGVAKEISVSALVIGVVLGLLVKIVKPDGTNEEFRWQVNWEESLNAV